MCLKINLLYNYKGEKSMKYKIISESILFSDISALEKLEDEVNSSIIDGWKPLGGVAINQHAVCQAMVKEDE